MLAVVVRDGGDVTYGNGGDGNVGNLGGEVGEVAAVASFGEC